MITIKRLSNTEINAMRICCSAAWLVVTDDEVLLVVRGDGTSHRETYGLVDWYKFADSGEWSDEEFTRLDDLLEYVGS